MPACASIEPDGYLGDSDPQVRGLLPDTSLPRCLDVARLGHLPTVFREGHLSQPSGKTIFFQPQGSAARRRTPSLATDARQRVNIDLATRQRCLASRADIALPCYLLARLRPFQKTTKFTASHPRLPSRTFLVQLIYVGPFLHPRLGPLGLPGRQAPTSMNFKLQGPTWTRQSLSSYCCQHSPRQRPR